MGIMCSDCSAQLTVSIARETKAAVVVCGCGCQMTVLPGRLNLFFPYRWPKVIKREFKAG